MIGRGDKTPRRRHPPIRRSLPERGWVQMLVLRVVHEAPMHGYQLIDELEGRGYVKSGRFETGSIYTILNRMEKRGLLSSKKMEAESGRVRRVYSVTEAGEAVLKEALRALMARKPVTDSLAEYYGRVFASEE